MAASPIPVETWARLPIGLYVTTDFMKAYDGRPFTLTIPDKEEAIQQNFNARRLDACQLAITDGDYPFEIMNKVAALRGKEADDGSRLPTFREFTEAAVYAAITKSVNDLYSTLRRNWFATNQMLRIHEKLPDGRYVADLLRFDDGSWTTVDEGIRVAGEGFMEVLGTQHGYPTRTNQNSCRIQNIDTPGFDDLPTKDASGYWFVGSDPVGQERIVLRDPYCGGGGLLHAGVRGGRSCSSGGVAALRVRGQTPDDVQAEISALSTERDAMLARLNAARKELEG